MGAHITYRCGDDLVGEPARPIPDPFVVGVVTVSLRTLLAAAVRHRKLRVSMTVDADPATRAAVREAIAQIPVVITGRDRLVALSQRTAQLKQLLADAQAEADELLDAELAVLHGDGT